MFLSGLFQLCHVTDYILYLPFVCRMSAGCRWRPGASASLRFMLPSSSWCRRRRTPARTCWSWSCRSWAITVTGVGRWAFVFVSRQMSHSSCFWFIIHDKQERGFGMYLAFVFALVRHSACLPGALWNIAVWIVQLIEHFCFFRWAKKVQM